MQGFLMEQMGAISGLVGLALLIGGAGWVAVGAFQKARIEALRQDNADLRARDTDNKTHIHDLESDRDKLITRVTACEGENITLKEMVLQRANVDQVVTSLTEVLNALSKILTEVQNHNNKAEAVWEKAGLLGDKSAGQ